MASVQDITITINPHSHPHPHPRILLIIKIIPIIRMMIMIRGVMLHPTHDTIRVIDVVEIMIDPNHLIVNTHRIIIIIIVEAVITAIALDQQ